MDEEELYSRVYEVLQRNVKDYQARIAMTGDTNNSIPALTMRNSYVLSYAIVSQIEDDFKQGSWTNRTVYDKTSGGVFVYFCAYGTNV
jgi:hypothetical protein